jgi:hypothetical protein
VSQSQRSKVCRSLRRRRMDGSLLQQIQKGKALKKAVTNDRSQALGAVPGVSRDASPASGPGKMGVRGQPRAAEQPKKNPAPLPSPKPKRVEPKQAVPQRKTPPESQSPDLKPALSPPARSPPLSTPSASTSPAKPAHRPTRAVPNAKMFNFPPVSELPPPPKRVTNHKTYASKGRRAPKSDSSIALQVRAFYSSVARDARDRGTTDPFPSVWAPPSPSSSSPMLPLS